MENLKKELQQAIMERFKQEQIVKGLEKELAEHTEEIFFEKYKGTKIKRDNLEYELFAV
jgi:co-chaperonin GroES (HSP10)